MLNLLVTGSAGFIGSHYIDLLLKQYSEYKIISLDKLTYAGSIDNLSKTLSHPNHKFIKGDILDLALLDELFKHYQINAVVHFAAESHVDNSILHPDAFIQTNIVGTFNLLEVSKKYWHNKHDAEHPFLYRFHHISTDEVYGSLGNEGLFYEISPYAPNSPYSASKASSDMIVRSYHKTYGLNTVITNCSNNFGPRQHDEKLIPTVIRNALAEKVIPIYGNGRNVRDWLYVTEHVTALNLVFHTGKQGETYNIGGVFEISNINIAKTICTILDKLHPRKNFDFYHNLINFVADRPGHDFRYAICCKKIKQLGWKPSNHFADNLLDTIQWYLKKYNVSTKQEIERNELIFA